MKARLSKLFTFVLAASLTTCVAAGCQNTDKTENPSSASTEVSTDTSDESSIVSEKNEESSEKVSTVSGTDTSTDNSTEESTEDIEQSDEESTEENTENSDEESTEETVEESSEDEKPGLSDLAAGRWTYVHEYGYMNMNLYEDGSVTFYASRQPDSWYGEWKTEDDNKVVVMISGGDDTYIYENDTLTYTGDTEMVFVRGTTEGEDDESEVPDEEDAEAELAKAVIGTWSSDGIGLSLDEDGVALLHIDEYDTTSTGTWSIEDGEIIIYLEDGEETYTYQDDVLISSETGMTLIKD